MNFDDVDDSFAKVIVKIYSRLIFEFSKSLKDRASIPFHIIVEEAHRYIQNDTDRFLIGYNIFERIAKEGRKYGVLLGIITQRPVELSDTVISQCSSFLIFKINHPTDVEYIRKMVPNISDEIIEKQKTLQPGTCLGFGMAFRIPLIVKLKMPDPAPLSGNCDVVNIWSGRQSSAPNINEPARENEVIQDMPINSNVSPLTFGNDSSNNDILINTDDKQIEEALQSTNNETSNDTSPILTDQSTILNNNISNPMIQNIPIENNNSINTEPLITPHTNDRGIDELNIDDIVNAPDIEDLKDE